MLEPVGPLPPSVYRRRRAVALGVVVLVVGLLVWGAAGLLGGADGADTTAAPDGPGTATSAPPTPRPAAFAAAEQAERARQAAEGGTPAGGAPRGGTAPGDGARAVGAAPPPGPAGLAAAVLPAPPGVIGRGLLPGAVLGPVPSSTPAPGAARPLAPAPRSRAPAPAAGAPSSGAPAATPGPAPSPGAAARSGQAPPRCADGVVRVLARTDKPRYAAGEKPVLNLVVRNTGPVACARDLDAARQAVAVVRKPGDGVWSSNDCAPGDTDDVRVLRPNEEAVFSVRWSGRTSRPGCPASREVVPPGRYQLLARLDDAVSAPAPFTLER